jgi:molybdopterin-guanine dinucleotide biosynthesis protein A
MGAPKAAALLGGRPLIAYPLESLAAVCERVVVVAKPGSDLPDLGALRWDEPEDPQHPIAGIRHALERAGAPILVVAADMPFVGPDTLALLAGELQPGLKAAVAFCDGRLEPLLAAYAPEALENLAAAPVDEPLRRTVESLMPVLVDVPPETVFNVNTPDDLAEAERRLRSG